MSNSIIIRKAELSDIEAITAIYNEAILNTTAHYYSEPKSTEERTEWFNQHGVQHPVYIAIYDQQVIAWASLSKWSVYYAFEETAECSLYIRPAFQGKGLGLQLLNTLLSDAAKAGLRSVIARILDGNPASIRIHEKAGFEYAGKLKEIGKKFGKHIDLHLMQKMMR